MEQFIGTKIINAKPMNRLEYNLFRGWELPKDENGADEGYLVEYIDGGKPNTDTYQGYVSWSPKEQFEKAYKSNGSLSFGDAIIYLKQGRKVARKGWNGKDMYLRYVDLYSDKFYGIVEKGEIDGTVLPWIGMKTVDNNFIPWLASQSDVLSNDWVIVE